MYGIVAVYGNLGATVWGFAQGSQYLAGTPERDRTPPARPPQWPSSAGKEKTTLALALALARFLFLCSGR